MNHSIGLVPNVRSIVFWAPSAFLLLPTVSGRGKTIGTIEGKTGVLACL